MRSNINSSSNLGRRISNLPPPPPLITPRTRRKNVRSQINRSIGNETIDLTSPPSSPASTTQLDTVFHPTNTEEFQYHEKMMHDSSKSSGYQGTEIVSQGSVRFNTNSSSDLGRISNLPPPPLITPRTRRKNVRIQINRSIGNETIDLTSPPSSPASTTQLDTVIHPTNTEEFQYHENMMHDSSKSSGYQGTEIVSQGSVRFNTNSSSDLGRISNLPPPPMAMIFNPIIDNVMSYSNQMYQNFIQHGSNNTRESQLQYQQQQLTVTQTRRTIVNNSSISETIDLTSPPSSPVPTTQQYTVFYPTFTEEFQNHEEIIHDSSKSNEYQDTEIVSQGNMQCNTTSLSDLSHISKLPPPPMAIIFNPIIDNVMSYSNQMYQNFIQHGSNNTRESQLQYQQQQLTVTQTRRTIVNNSSISEMIDLTSPPSSPDLTSQQNTVFYPNFTEEFLSHVEIMMHDSFISTEYQIFVTEINGEKIYCINSMPYDSTILMIGLKYLICEHLPMGSVTKCVDILRNYLKIQLTKADNDQLNMLFVQRMDVMMNPENALMVRAQDLKPVFKQLKSLMSQPSFRISNF
ncbi:uncharacterized protein LOC113555689 [Rhopalosiphum maidis]|uniref:uncharacterized protein LOC113555689 n=1 Tax=Rhopalosiphum maidis TaxID=43146 RepID=UPI000EFEE944|nr:uncharacterized protein LOC113555689 [Rhopalosiphum maidis]